jgi:hypothetical protein
VSQRKGESREDYLARERARSKVYYETHLEERRAAGRAIVRRWHAAHPGYAREWQKRNWERYKELQRNHYHKSEVKAKRSQQAKENWQRRARNERIRRLPEELWPLSDALHELNVRLYDYTTKKEGK